MGLKFGFVNSDGDSGISEWPTEVAFGRAVNRDVDPMRAGIEQLIEKWRSTAHGFRTAVPLSAFEEQQADAYETAADELEALLTPEPDVS